MARKRKKKAVLKEVPLNAAFYILWNPDSNLPPRVRFDTVEKAVAVADSMARKTGEGFIVMKAIQKLELPPPPLLVTTYT